jgi:hypothetical protein
MLNREVTGKGVDIRAATVVVVRSSINCQAVIAVRGEVCHKRIDYFTILHRVFFGPPGSPAGAVWFLRLAGGFGLTGGCSRYVRRRIVTARIDRSVSHNRTGPGSSDGTRDDHKNEEIRDDDLRSQQTDASYARR